jgi:hypothetical protein
MTENTLPPLPIRHTWDIDYESRKPYDLYTADQLRAYAAQAVAQERERCAAICDDQSDRARTSTGASRADNCARRIRARSPSPQPQSAWRPIEEAPNGSAEQFATSDDPNCVDGSKACIDCLMRGACLNAPPPSAGEER